MDGARGLRDRAERLRSLHVPGDPLILPNAWDAETARRVAAAGFPAIATASAAITASLGFEDDDNAPVDDIFAAIARIARSVEVPVTADIEAGYGLSPGELVERLLDAGAVGCNLEDSNHRRGGLVAMALQAERVAGVRAAADRAEVPLVINARTDVFVREIGDPESRVDEAVDRGRQYRKAGADCIYPIWLIDEAAIARFVVEFDGAVNVYARPEAPSLMSLREIGVARISYGPWLQQVAMRAVDVVLARIVRGESPFTA
jgi:2-methylisocitrate lyase-like PEP mutase family enzyme